MKKTHSRTSPWNLTVRNSITCTLDMSPKLLALALVPLFAAAAFAATFFYFYRGSYDPPPSVDIPYEEITSPGVSTDHALDSARTQLGSGFMVIDALHANAFTGAELVTLNSWVANRGYEVEIIGGFAPARPQDRLQLLDQKLRRADSFLVILPQINYAEAEVDLVERFVNKGGKLVLVSDPSRPNRINALAKRFGIEFQPDYLYNTVDYDQNFRHIYVRDFQPDPITNALDTIALFIAGSVRSSGNGVAFTDSNTKSSLFENFEKLYPIAWGNSRNVLAIADFTFIVPPYNSLLDNDRLLSNVADYLTDSQREYVLADFPHFFERSQDNNIDIIPGQPSLWDIGLVVRNGLSAYGLSSAIRELEDFSRDTVFLGLYEDSAQVSQYLQAAGISIDDVITLPFAPDLSQEDTAIALLQGAQDRQVLVILADTPQALNGTVESLFDGEFREDLVSDNLGLRNIQ